MYDKIKQDLTDAMKSGDKFKLSVIRMLKSALMVEETKAGRDSELSDDEILSVIKREVKKRNSSIEEYEKYGREDTVNDLKKEIEILSVYLPPEMSDEELESIIDTVIAELNATTIKDMGTVMKEVGARTKGSADMSKVSSIVKSKLG